jgi:hypothetical protein
MRARPLALLLLLAALTGCPAVLSDWTIAGGPTNDATADAGGPDAAGDSSLGPSGSLDASIDAEPGQAPEDAAARESSPEASESGSNDSGSVDASPIDAGPCNDGGPLYLHHVGLSGLTWQDCVPTGTYNATQALEACAVYAAATDAGALPNGLPLCSLENDPAMEVCASSAVLNINPAVAWTYVGAGQNTTTGHVAAFGTHSDGSCTTPQDPAWD